MLMPASVLLHLLLLLGRPGTSISYKLPNAGPVFSCLHTALSEVTRSQLEDVPLLSKGSVHYLAHQDPSSGEDTDGEKQGKEKRTFSSSGGGAGGTRYRYPAQLPQKGRLYPGKPKSEQRAKFTLSLDVPTNIMNILFNIAKAKSLRAKATANAHLMARIGRKK